MKRCTTLESHSIPSSVLLRFTFHVSASSQLTPWTIMLLFEGIRDTSGNVFTTSDLELIQRHVIAGRSSEDPFDITTFVM